MLSFGNCVFNAIFWILVVINGNIFVDIAYWLWRSFAKIYKVKLREFESHTGQHQ